MALTKVSYSMIDGAPVNVLDFGAVGDGITDDYPAFLAATTYCNDNDVHHLIIPPGNYHLSEPWLVPFSGNFVSCGVTGYGAVLDNTVIIANTTGVNGLTVDGAPDCGFCILRGQGAYHSYLFSKNNGSYGFYFGVASRQHLTVSNSSGFEVGEIVTGGSSSSSGEIERIEGNVLRLIKCNIGSTAKFFTVGETVTGGTSSSTATVSVVTTPLGVNYQVTRTTFDGLIAVSNANKGFYWDGSATVNRSFMNANTWISPAGVGNGGKGWVVNSAFFGPGGGSQHNYNTFININMEGNGDQSLADGSGRQNTYIGGHFVDVDGSGESVAITDAFNFILGGRYVGSQNLSGVPFYYYNSDVSGIKAQFTSVDTISTGAFSVTGPPFMPSGWSILPTALVTDVIAPDNQTGHLIRINMVDFLDGNYITLRLTLSGFRNQAGGYADINNAQLNLSMSSRAGDPTQNAVIFSTASTNGITINSVTVSSAGLITINIDTTQLIFSFHKIVEYFDSDSTDAR